MYNVVSPGTSGYKNQGSQQFIADTGILKRLVLVPTGTEIATEALALNKDTWMDNLNAAIGERWYILHPIVEVEPTSEASIYKTWNTGISEYVRSGKTKVKATFAQMGTKNKNDINSLHLGSFSVYEISDTHWIKGYTLDGIKFLPKQLDTFEILPESYKTGSENPHVACEFQYTDVQQSNLFEVALKPDWYAALELESIKSVIATLTSVTATTFAFNIFGYDGAPWSSAVKEDIYLRKTSESGTLIPITSIAAVSGQPGYYTGVIGTQTSGTFYLGLLQQPTATTQGVETDVVTSYVATIP